MTKIDNTNKANSPKWKTDNVFCTSLNLVGIALFLAFFRDAISYILLWAGTPEPKTETILYRASIFVLIGTFIAVIAGQFASSDKEAFSWLHGHLSFYWTGIVTLFVTFICLLHLIGCLPFT